MYDQRFWRAILQEAAGHSLGITEVQSYEALKLPLVCIGKVEMAVFFKGR